MLTDQQKKIIIIGAVLIVVGVVGLIIFFSIASPKPPATTEQPTATSTETGVGFPSPGQSVPGQGETLGQSTSTLPENISQQPSQTPGGEPGSTIDRPIPRDNKIEDVTQGGSLGSTLAPGGGVQFYNRDDNKFYKVNPDGTKTTLSDKEFYNVSNVTWSPAKNTAIIYYPDDNKVIYDFNTDTQVTLPAHWGQLEFSPGSNNVAFISHGLNPDDTWLGVVNSDGTGAQAIEKLGQNWGKAIVSWSPNNQSIGMFVDSVNMESNKVYFIGKNGENFRSMVVNGRGFQPLWSTTGQELLYSVYNSGDNLRPQLWVSSASGETIGDNLRPLNVETFASKCVYMNDQEIICGVPTQMPDGAGLMPVLADNTIDDIYLINTSTGTRIPLDTSGRFNVATPMFSATDHSLYFFNNQDGSFHKIEIPQR